MATVPRQLARAGYAIFPIKKNAKNPPLVKWREESTNDIVQIEAWEKQFPGCNFGLDAGKSGLVVIDIDVHNSDGYVTMEQLRVEKGYELPDTLVFETPSGGQHHVYRGDAKTTAGVLGSGVDTRGVGGYIVLPGSSIDGRGYRVSRKSRIAEAPSWLAPALDTRDGGERQRVDVDVDLDTELAVDNARRYLGDPARAKPSIEGDGGSDNAFRVACNTKDYGLSEAICLDLLLETWNNTCSPPWSVDELQTVVQNAYAYGQNSAGAKSAAAVFDAPVSSAYKERESVEKPEIELLPMMDLTEAMAPAPPQEWLIDGWIPHNEMCLFTGKEGTGKSLMALQLAMSAAYGIPWLGHELERKYNVLYLSCEDDRAEIQRRCNAIGRLPEYAFIGGDVDPLRFRPVPLVGQDNAMVHEENWKLNAGSLYIRLNHTLNHLRWNEPLIILDTLSDMFMANENNRAMVQHFVKSYLGRIRTDYRATIITLAHPPKSEADYSGSTAWPAAHRACVGIKKHDAEALPDHRVVELWKGNRTGLQGKQFYVEWRAGAFHRVSGMDIPELEELALEQDIELVYGRAVQMANAGEPMSDVPQGVGYIGKERIFDSDGGIMNNDKKTAILKILKDQGRLVRGQVGGRNTRRRGLIPAPEAKDVFNDD